MLAGAALAATGVGLGLRKLDDDRIPEVALLSSAFFVASLIHVPIGPSSAHLILNGLAGVVLGWAVFPALLVALLLQAVLFGFGGLTVLGVNVLTMALPAVACHYVFRRATRGRGAAAVFAWGFAAGAAAVLGAAMLVCLALITTGKEFARLAELVVLAHVPVALVEGLVTGSVVSFLAKVKPELLPGRVATPESTELSDA